MSDADQTMITEDGNQRMEATSSNGTDNLEFKISIRNLPTPLNYQEARRIILQKFALKGKGHKIRLVNGSTNKGVLYVSFKSREEQQEALATINGANYRGKIFLAKPSSTLNGANTFKKELAQVAPIQEGTQEDFDLSVLSSVTPLWNSSYEQQLTVKAVQFRNSLLELNGKIKRHLGLASKINFRKDALEFEVGSPIPSPVVDGYRNKCEFTIGYDPAGRRRVGFRASTFKEGSIHVGSIEAVPSVSNSMKAVVNRFQDFIEVSSYVPYDPITKAGLFHNLLVRETRNGDMLLMLKLSSGVLTPCELKNLVNEILAHFQLDNNNANGSPKSVETSDSMIRIISFYVKLDEPSGQKERNAPELFFGKAEITENIMGMQFQISPESFFQVNSHAAEELFSKVSLLANLDADTTLLDVCCGTGTIGIACAKLTSVAEVIGLELCAPAVADAIQNAELNQVAHRCRFVQGRAEMLISAAINSTSSKRLVAVVDPPRAGLNSAVISALRKTTKITTIIFIACRLGHCTENLVALCGMSSKKYSCSPFVIEKVVLIDMFPYTNDCEAIVMLKRKSRN